MATQNLVSASTVRQLLQSYDDAVGADSWRIDSGLEAECGGTGYPTSNWGGQTYDPRTRIRVYLCDMLNSAISLAM